jgi:uncharacterized protein
MSIFLLIVLSIPTISLLWWWWTDRRIRRIAPAPRPRWATLARCLLAALVLVNLVAYAWIFISRLAQLEVETPVAMLTSAYIWHMVSLPIMLLLSLLLTMKDIAAWITMRLAKPNPAAHTHTPTAMGERAQQTLTRRQTLAAGALAFAPIGVHTTALTRGVTQLDHFRVRRLDVALPTLPAALDGLTIAHVTDTHVGRFTKGATLDAIVHRVNDLKPDIIALTGDLIDFALKDLPNAVAMVKQFAARHAVVLCEGNHDLFESRRGFEDGCKNAGLNLLINESLTVSHHGAPIELLGARWGPTEIDNVRTARARGPMYDQHTQFLASRRNPAAFPILLAHHPHAFETAAAQGIPLTLAGHTHGGQFRLAERYGLGEVIFKYVSGLYTLPTPDGSPAACVVSNGTGNWFPLRINTPAEVIHITLRRTM